MIKLKEPTPEEKAYTDTVVKIAGNISKLTKAVAALLNDGPLKRKTIVVLLAASSGQPKSIVEIVLKAVEDLDKDWLNQ